MPQLKQQTGNLSLDLQIFAQVSFHIGVLILVTLLQISSLTTLCKYWPAWFNIMSFVMGFIVLQ